MKTKLIPCIFLKNQMAVKDFNDLTVIETDPIRLAKKFCEANADELLIFDLSKEDNEHEGNIDLIHELCENVPICVTAAGNVKRMEDVKKLLYAGCKRACLNYSLSSNVELTKEVCDKFGKEKIIACIKSKEDLSLNKSVLEKSIQTILFLDRHTYKDAKNEGFKKNSIVCLPNVLLDKLLEYINDENIEGITGDVINDNADNLDEIKELVYQSMVSFDTFKLNSDGLIPVIVQDYKTNQVLMLAYMNKEAYEKTLRSGTMTYFSRSRQSLWLKGETSGHFQYVKSLSYDCDSDTLLAKVEQIGAACHTGAYSCFFNDIITYDYEEKSPLSVLTDVYDVILDRKKNPKEGSYTNYLFDKGIDKILKKVGEEATEIVIAAKNPNPNEIKYEISDFLYHVMVLMAEKGVTWDEIMTELANR